MRIEITNLVTNVKYLVFCQVKRGAVMIGTIILCFLVLRS